jgi:hypothetical protein
MNRNLFRHPDFYCGLAFLAFALFLLYFTFKIPPGIVPNSLEADFLPKILIGAIILLAFSLMFRKPGEGPDGIEDQGSIELNVPGSVSRPLMLFGWLFLCLLVMAWAGFYLTMTVALAGVFVIFHEYNWKMNILVAAVILISIYLVFDRLLAVPFPEFDTLMFSRG